MGILIGWIINAICLLLLAYIMPAVQVAGFGTALIVALVLGLLNIFIRPVLILLTLPVNLLT
ncbi:MAG: phage holin family protein, partial [Gammaproteobacteria bacterium]